MKTVYLISCVAKKRHSEVSAEQLYCSPWFKKAREWVLREMSKGDEWYILSAKHGLLNPSALVGPYNETLNKMHRADRLRWAQQVTVHLSNLLHKGDTVVFLAGQKYREFLEPSVLALSCQVSVPMRGMRIGKQLNWLGNSGES
jgi:hypothetical protein